MPSGPIGETWAPDSSEWWEEGSWGLLGDVATVPEFTYVRGLVVRSSHLTHVQLRASGIRNLQVRRGSDATDVQVRP